MVPLPVQAGLVTVTTMSPAVTSTAANILTCPVLPAAKVAVSAPAVVKYEVVVAKSMAADANKSSLLGK